MRICWRSGLASITLDRSRSLHDAVADGTDNSAHRAPGPAVEMRKSTADSRSEAGAEARAVLAGVMRPAQQQGLGVVETYKNLAGASWTGKDAPLLIDTS